MGAEAVLVCVEGGERGRGKDGRAGAGEATPALFRRRRFLKIPPLNWPRRGEPPLGGEGQAAERTRGKRDEERQAPSSSLSVERVARTSFKSNRWGKEQVGEDVMRPSQAVR